MNFYQAWHYLINHPMFNEKFQSCLDVDVVKVNPKTNCVDDNDSLNTKTQIWLECGPYFENQITHDIDLDCGGNTFEDAIIKLAKLVKKYYTDDRNKILLRINEKYN